MTDTDWFANLCGTLCLAAIGGLFYLLWTGPHWFVSVWPWLVGGVIFVAVPVIGVLTVRE